MTPIFERLDLGSIDADFATKYFLESYRRDLHNAFHSTALIFLVKIVVNSLLNFIEKNAEHLAKSW